MYGALLGFTFRTLSLVATLLSHALLTFSFIRVSIKYLEHFQDSLPSDCDVGISRTLQDQILHSRAFLRLSYIRLSRLYLVQFQELGFSIIGLLLQFLVHFQEFCSLECFVSVSRASRPQDSLLLDCYDNVWRTFRILFHRMVSLVSHAHSGLSFVGLL